MEKKILIIMAGLLLISLNVFADDVSIDSDGNVKTGVANANAELEVTGASAEGAIRGTTSGTGASGVYGINTTNSDYGLLGYPGYGVYGNSKEWAGYFQGNARVTGNLIVDGTITGETDPKVGPLLMEKWCTSDGSQVNCTNNPPITTEYDPQVGILTSGKWCTSDGTAVNCTSNAPSVSESDPEVGSNTTNYIPKWNGTALVTGSIFDNGNVGIGTAGPETKLQITGGVLKVGDNGGWAPNSIQFEPQVGFHRISFNDLRFFDWVAGYDNVIFKNGKVGIGTSAPDAKLDAVNLIRVLGNSSITWPTTGSGLELAHNSSSNTGYIQSYNRAGSSWGTLDINAATVNVGGSPGNLNVGAGNLAVTGGNVGIGTTAPTAKLSVVAPGSGQIEGSAMSSVSKISAGTLGATAGDSLALSNVGFMSSNNSSLGIRAYRTQNGTDWTTTAVGFTMDVDDTAAAGGASVWLNANGNVGIRNTNPSAELDVAGTAKVVALVLTSDSRLKKNISTIENALDKVERLRGVEFEWRRDEFPERGFRDGKQIGLIAQEVEQVLPELVTVSSNNGQKSVEYANIVAVLIEAVKELKTHNEELRARIETLEQK